MCSLMYIHTIFEFYIIIGNLAVFVVCLKGKWRKKIVNICNRNVGKSQQVAGSVCASMIQFILHMFVATIWNMFFFIIYFSFLFITRRILKPINLTFNFDTFTTRKQKHIVTHWHTHTVMLQLLLFFTHILDNNTLCETVWKKLIVTVH